MRKINHPRTADLSLHGVDWTLTAPACICGSCARVPIGEDVTEYLDVIAPKFRVIVTRRPRYACSASRESIVQAPAPAHLIEGKRSLDHLFSGA